MKASPEDLLLTLPRDVWDVAKNTLPAVETTEADEIEVEVVLRIKHVRHRYKAGRAKGRQTWNADSAVIVSAAGKEPIFTDTSAFLTGAWLNKPKPQA